MYFAKGYQCVCHTLYKKAAGLNSWEVLFAFIPSRINQEVSVESVSEHVSEICSY